MNPVVLRNAEELNGALAAHRIKGESIGFVPTMGALHEGHAALLEQCAKECAVAVLSIFVNPTQFGPNEDFSRYPRTFEADLEIARTKGVRYVFAPEPKTIYPEGYSTFIEVEGVSEPLCGRFRPGHFRGVATVVHRLLALVRPDVAYFGLKDLQQCMVIERMVHDLSVPVKLKFCATIREADGLAKSSRNRYLSPAEREKSTVIYRALQVAHLGFLAGEREVAKLLELANAELAKVPEFQVQYAEIRSYPDLHSIERVENKAALAIAGFLGKTRLIDNFVFDAFPPA